MTFSAWISSSTTVFSDNSTDTADDISGEGYELTRQPRLASWSHPYTIPLLSPGSLEYIDPTETSPEASIYPPIPAVSNGIMSWKLDLGQVDIGTPTVSNGTTTMNIPLVHVDLVQLFLRADGSVKGLRFDYGDGDWAHLGCCVAEPGCWYAFFRPSWLLYTPAPGHPVGRGFVPVKSISFANIREDGETETNAIRMKGSLVFRLSPDGLEIDTNRDAGVYGTTFQPPPPAISDGSRRDKRTFKRAAGAVKSWLGKNCVLSMLSTKVRDIGNKARELATKKMRRKI